MDKTNDISGISPFNNCPALDGYHCQSNSLAKIYHYYGHPLSEDMLLGLGAGMGFIYWKMKMGESDYIFIGGRGNNKGFFNDLGKRTGVRIEVRSTTSINKAEAALLHMLTENKPVMVFGDMGFLPWFEFPEDYHFGGHTFVVCGYDGEKTVLASDMDPKVSGLKKGFYCPITLEQLSRARGSAYKPLPPKNTYLEFDFSGCHNPEKEDIYSSIRQTVESQLNPPIKNLGVRGIRHAGKEILKWPGVYSDHTLRMNLFNLYIFIEIGGTGGGCFRNMYSRFLKESADITGNKELAAAAQKLAGSAALFTEIAFMFNDTKNDPAITEKVESASGKFGLIADIEEEVFGSLNDIIN